MKKINQNKILIAIFIWWVILIVVIKKLNLKISIIGFSNFVITLLSYKIKKGILVNYYDVDKATFNKWIKYFCYDIILNYDLYKKKRTITLEEVIKILKKLGRLNDHEVLSKKDIIKICEGDYKDLRVNVIRFPLSYGINKESYRKLRKFPPTISMQLKEQYGT